MSGALQAQQGWWEFTSAARGASQITEAQMGKCYSLENFYFQVHSYVICVTSKLGILLVVTEQN